MFLIPGDTESPARTSGIRLGSPAMTTRGLKEEDFAKIGQIIAQALKNNQDEAILKNLDAEVLELTSKYPLWYE